MKKNRLKDYPELKRIIGKGLLIMKLSLILMVVGVLQGTASVYSQNWRMSMNEKSIVVKDVLTKIENSSEFRFFYEEKKVNVEKKVDIKITNATIEDIMNLLFNNEGVEYKVLDSNLIVLKPKGDSSSPTINTSQQIKSVYGKVTDASGTLPGVNIMVKGSSNGTITDVNGSYSLQNVRENATLLFSFVGYLTQEIEIKGRTEINVTLQPDVIGLEEIVTIGYGSTTVKDATGAIGSLRERSFEKGTIMRAGDLLVGKMPGVVITTNSGTVHQSTDIHIRGGSSLNASNAPLIVLDGAPIASLSSINPNDIESFTILKDASSTAIYGSRASNGVIMITTKQGRKGEKVKIQYNSNLSVSNPMREVDVFTGDEFRDAIKGHFGANSKEAALLGPANTDWRKLIFGSSMNTDHNLSLTGSTDFMPYRVSIGYTRAEGTADDNMNRYTASIGLNPTFFDDHLRINLNLKGTVADNKYSSTFYWLTANADPTMPIYTDKPQFEKYGGYYFPPRVDGTPNVGSGNVNPIASRELGYNNGTSMRSMGNIQFDYKFHFIPELRANLNLAYEYNDSETISGTEPNAIWTYGKQGTRVTSGAFNNTKSDNYSTLLDFYLNYKKNISLHALEAMAGYSWQHFYDNSENDQGTFYEDDGKKYTTTSVELKNGLSKSELQLISFFGRLNYEYNNRYLLTASIRYDGTSRFSKENNNRWGIFPSVAAAWRITEESFLKGNDILSNAKLRASWGVTGQQDIGGRYPYLGTYNYGGADMQYYIPGVGLTTTITPSAYNENIKWEETSTLDFGLDYGFFNNRFWGTFDYYFRETTDMLTYLTPPAGANFSSGALASNVGKMEITGFEMSIESDMVKTRDFNWNVGVNFAYNTRKITQLVANGGETDRIIVGTTIYNAGYDPSTYYVFRHLFDAKGKPLDGTRTQRFKDSSGPKGIPDGTVDDYDKYMMDAQAMPKTTLGINTSFTYT